MSTDASPTAVVERLLAAFNANDIDAMRAVLAVRLIAYVPIGTVGRIELTGATRT